MNPLVSIGIPVTDRVDGLSFTIDSLLEQSHGKFEVLLVDDTDDEIASAVCVDVAERDTRVTYVKTPGHFGVLPSHAEALARSKGTYFMWLGVGDRLDCKFLEICTNRMEERPDLSLAIGSAKPPKFEEGAPQTEINVSDGDPVQRVESFLESDIGLDLWYGLFRRPFVAAIPFRNAIGYEFAFLAEVAFAGKMETIEGAWSERSIQLSAETAAAGAGNTEEEPHKQVDTLGVPAFQWSDPYLVLAAQLFCNIAFLSDNFASLPQIDRLRLALRAYTQIAERWGISDEGQFISFAVRIYPEERITDRLHELRHYLSENLFSQTSSKALFGPLSHAEEIINGLCRLKIGRLPPTQLEREIVSKIRTRFDATKSEDFKNRAILALALFL
jgi:hypothetical protein